MIKRFCAIFLLTGISGFLLAGGNESGDGQPAESSPPAAADPSKGPAGGSGNTLRIVFAGDIMGHDSQIAAARVDSNTYDYTGCFRHLKPYLEEADIAVGNLEVTHAGPPFKGYPRFSSPDELSDALLDAGFNVLVNANNHALDRGKEGFERTQQVLDEKGMILTGTFLSPDQKELNYPLILEKNGILVALLNYTYGTNSIVADTPNVVNYIDTMLIRQDIRKAQLVEPDFIIACMHWGKEYQREENSTQQSLARFLFSQGVDAIIGSHPHVVQPIRYEHDGSHYIRPVVYSLGNFVSNQRDRYRNGGILFGLELHKTDATRITGIDFLPVYVHKPRRGERFAFELIPSGIPGDMIESIGFTDEELAGYLEFCEDTKDHLSNVTRTGV
jgi:poly-gamma-glutamate synthesis protein (capsule biosynthesis protein)